MKQVSLNKSLTRVVIHGPFSWRRHKMKTLLALLTLVRGIHRWLPDSPHRRSVMQSFDLLKTSFSKLMNKFSCLRLETPWRPCDFTGMRMKWYQPFILSDTSIQRILHISKPFPQYTSWSSVWTEYMPSTISRYIRLLWVYTKHAIASILG